jgi:hypothetical protein
MEALSSPSIERMFETLLVTRAVRNTRLGAGTVVVCDKPTATHGEAGAD